MEYSFLKLFHVIAVLVFLGNVFTGLFWMQQAFQSKDVKIIAHTIKSVVKSDLYFTIPGVVTITFFGFIAATNGQFPILGTGWILWSLLLFTLSGVVFMQRVVPLQKQMSKMTMELPNEQEFNWEQFSKSYQQWKFWGYVALLAPVAAMVLMVLKVPA
ncbi:MAG: DUF2269 family protein [Bacteroidetes bacterium]|nr:DUF2269 family protein [Bacteroidota bacterium]